MNAPRLILIGAISLVLLLAGCSPEDNSSASLDQQPLSPDAELGKQVIIDFWNAFNSYDLEKCLSYLGPTYDDQDERAYIDNITISAAVAIFSDSCSDFSNWLAGGDWQIDNDAFYGHHDGDATNRYLTLQPKLDLSSYSGQTVTVSWEQWEFGSLEPDDTLYFAFSGDDGINWSDNIEAFSNKIGSTPQSFSYTIPGQYLTADFRVRFYLENFRGFGGRAGIAKDLESFEMGRVFGVKLVPSEFKEYPPLPDGRLDIRYKLSIKPEGLQEDKYQMWYMEKSNGIWKIALRATDLDRTPPESPQNLQLSIVSANRVDLTWEDKSSRETGYRVERALHTSFKTDLVIVQLPADTQSYSDTTTVGGVIYYYRVFAFSEAGDSASSGIYPARMPGS